MALLEPSGAVLGSIGPVLRISAINLKKLLSGRRLVAGQGVAVEVGAGFARLGAGRAILVDRQHVYVHVRLCRHLSYTSLCSAKMSRGLVTECL